jgi:hypothetical protein
VIAVDPILDIALRAALALLFGAAARHKLRDVARFRATLADHRLVPPVLVTAASIAVIAAEVGVVTALVIPVAPAAGPLGAALLAAVYAAALAANLLRGRRHLDCGCLGVAGRETISWWLVARNALLVAVALAGLAPTAVRPLVWMDAVTGAGLVTLATLVWLALDGLLANLPAIARLREASA